MRPNNQNRRGRGRGPRKPHGGPHGGGHGGGGGGQSKAHSFDSGGSDIRVRGNAYQVLEKYLQLARDAGTAGDRVAAENFLQHADHYYRVVAAQNEGQRPRIGGREISVADVNVQNVSQGLSAALSGHGHSGADDLPPENQGGNHGGNHGGGQMGNHGGGNHNHGGNGQMRSNPQSGEHENPQGAAHGEPQRESQPGNGADASAGGNAESQQFVAPDEQPDYPEELLPADAAGNNAPRDGGQPQEGRNHGRQGRGRRRGPGRRVRSEGEEAGAAPAPAPTSGDSQ
jgi:hypothetical protein